MSARELAVRRSPHILAIAMSALPISLRLCVFALALLLVRPVANAAPEHDPEAVAIVDRLSALYRTATAFSVTASTQVLRGPGVNVQAKRTYSILVQKPDKMTAELKNGEQTVRMFVDGKTLTMLTSPPNEYRQAPAPASLVPFLQKMAPGLDTLVAPDPKPKIMENVTRLTIVGEDKIDDVDCVRLRFEQPDATVDLLVQKGDQPLMRRLMLKTADNSTVIQFDLRDWKIDPKLEGDPFLFQPPPDAKKVTPEVSPREP
jgi:hypothetical protein